MNKVRIGIIGIGNMGSSHAEQIMNGEIPGGELSAICDISPARLKWAQGTFGNKVQLYDSADALFTADIDAVIIATPHYDHPGLSIKALKKKSSRTG